MFTARVLYADTDLAGVVYHANYLRWFEAARTDLLCRAGADPARLHLDEGIVFTIAECDLKYHAPARYGDELAVDVFPVKLGPARLVLGYEVREITDGRLCVTGHTTIAALDAVTGKVVRLPEDLRAGLARLLEERA